ncbi:MAG TPA: Gfo/Idh/MocA family oxidoreductase [Proteobacteria bacterium]|nr:Gfo/Idh/MocA family oxidoreductase [Pseudomonadota bacterium]
MQKMRAGVVGVGHMGGYHVIAYTELLEADLVGIADPRIDRARTIAETYNTKAYEDYRDLFDKVDAVSVCVPTELHYRVTKDFLEAGISVLVEKPITPTLREAEELFELAAKRNCILQVGHVERYNGAAQELMNIVENPYFIESRRIGPFSGRNIKDGVVMDLMIHDLDIVLRLVSSPVEAISAYGGRVFSDREDFATVLLSFESGTVASLIASRVSEYKTRTLAVSQKDMYIFLDYTDQEIFIHRQAKAHWWLLRDQIKYKQDSLIERIFVHKENPLKLQLKHFLHRCMGEVDTELEPEKELASLRVALEIVKQLNERG